MQRSRRLERQRLLQSEYGKQSSKQGWLEGGRCGILVEQLQTAVTGCCLPMPSLVSGTVAVPSPAHSLVHRSRSPAAVLGVLFCPILNRTLAAGGETVGSGPRARARALWVAQSSCYIEKKWRLKWCGIVYRIRIRCVPWHQCIEITGGQDQGSKLP